MEEIDKTKRISKNYPEASKIKKSWFLLKQHIHSFLISVWSYFGHTLLNSI